MQPLGKVLDSAKQKEQRRRSKAFAEVTVRAFASPLNIIALRVITKASMSHESRKRKSLNNEMRNHSIACSFTWHTIRSQIRGLSISCADSYSPS